MIFSFSKISENLIKHLGKCYPTLLENHIQGNFQLSPIQNREVTNSFSIRCHFCGILTTEPRHLELCRKQHLFDCRQLPEETKVTTITHVDAEIPTTSPSPVTIKRYNASAFRILQSHTARCPNCSYSGVPILLLAHLKKCCPKLLGRRKSLPGSAQISRRGISRGVSSSATTILAPAPSASFSGVPRQRLSITEKLKLQREKMRNERMNEPVQVPLVEEEEEEEEEEEGNDDGLSCCPNEVERREGVVEGDGEDYFQSFHPSSFGWVSAVVNLFRFFFSFLFFSFFSFFCFVLFCLFVGWFVGWFVGFFSSLFLFFLFFLFLFFLVSVLFYSFLFFLFSVLFFFFSSSKDPQTKKTKSRWNRFDNFNLFLSLFVFLLWLLWLWLFLFLLFLFLSILVSIVLFFIWRKRRYLFSFLWERLEEEESRISQNERRNSSSFSSSSFSDEIVWVFILFLFYFYVSFFIFGQDFVALFFVALFSSLLFSFLIFLLILLFFFVDSCFFHFIFLSFVFSFIFFCLFCFLLSFFFNLSFCFLPLSWSVQKNNSFTTLCFGSGENPLPLENREKEKRTRRRWSSSNIHSHEFAVKRGENIFYFLFKRSFILFCFVLRWFFFFVSPLSLSLSQWKTNKTLRFLWIKIFKKINK